MMMWPYGCCSRQNQMNPFFVVSELTSVSSSDLSLFLLAILTTLIKIRLNYFYFLMPTPRQIIFASKDANRKDAKINKNIPI